MVHHININSFLRISYLKSYKNLVHFFLKFPFWKEEYKAAMESSHERIPINPSIPIYEQYFSHVFYETNKENLMTLFFVDHFLYSHFLKGLIKKGYPKEKVNACHH